MNNSKKLDDFLPDRNAVFIKSFQNNPKNKINIITEQKVIEKIKTVLDPEIPVNIYDLGLIYSIKIENDNKIYVEMTLTTPNCPVAGTMPQKVGEAISSIEDVTFISVKLMWEPQWSKNMMSEDAKLALGII